MNELRIERSCSQERSQIMTAISQKLTSAVAEGRRGKIPQAPAGAMLSRGLAHPVAQWQVVGAVRFELTTSTSRT